MIFPFLILKIKVIMSFDGQILGSHIEYKPIEPKKSGLYVPPHRRSRYEHSQHAISLFKQPANVESDSHIYDLKKVGMRIKHASLKELEAMMNGTVEVNGRHVELNTIHWTQIINRLAGKDFARFDTGRVVKKCVWAMREHVKSCSLGSISQIAKGLGILQIDDRATQDWIIPLTIDALKSVKPGDQDLEKEFFMLLNGLSHILTISQLNSMLDVVEPFLVESDRLTDFCKSARPNTLVTFMICYSKAKHFSSVFYHLWDEIKIKWNKMTLKESLYLFRLANLESCNGLEEKLKSMEDEIAVANDLSEMDLIQAWHAFVNQNYQSEWLSERMSGILDSNETDPYDKISILYGHAKLNDINQKEVLKQLLKDLDNEDECRSLPMPVWLKLFYASSILLSDDDEVKEIFQNMVQRQHFYEGGANAVISSLYKSCTLLGVEHPDNEMFAERYKRNAKYDFLSDNLKGRVKLLVAAKGGSADFDLLEDFECTGIRFNGLLDKNGNELRPIAIKSVSRIPCLLGQPEKMTGKGIRGVKFLEKLGYDTWFSICENEEHDVEESIYERLEHLIDSLDKDEPIINPAADPSPEPLKDVNATQVDDHRQMKKISACAKIVVPVFLAVSGAAFVGMNSRN